MPSFPPLLPSPHAPWSSRCDRFRLGRARVCNPYTQHGVLNVSLETPSENVWQPVAAPDGCEAVDYMTLLQDVVRTGDVDGALEFARGRTIAILGDSVDRDHVTDFCQLVGARPE